MYSQTGILKLSYFTRKQRQRQEDLKSERARWKVCCRELVSSRQTYTTLTFSHYGTELSGDTREWPKKWFFLKFFLNWEIQPMQSFRYAQRTIARVARCTGLASKSCDVSRLMLQYWVTSLFKFYMVFSKLKAQIWNLKTAFYIFSTSWSETPYD